MAVFKFEIFGHSTRREWAVYIIVANNKSETKKILYVGKVGDNRDGCNPIISRIGNHFSFNEVHSQIRTKMKNTKFSSTENNNYTVFYSTFGGYNKEKRLIDKDRINENERQLNYILQSKIANIPQKFELLNPYKGVGISKKVRTERLKHLKLGDINALTKLAEEALA
jgi:hypothetical protein